MAAANFILQFLLLSSAAAAPHKIPVYTSLRPGQNSTSVWLSPSGKFAFGFLDTPKGYAVCIYLNAFTERTVVWTANKINPILPNNIASLIINPDGIQLWQTMGTYSYMYNQFVNTERVVASASMLDSGNFVLYNHDGGVIWQSFDYPTDSLLPGQRLVAGGELVSTASQTDLAIGLFRMKMQTDGNLVQYPLTTPDSSDNAYFSSGTYGIRNLSLNLGNDGRLYFQDGGTYFHNLTSGGIPYYPVAGTIYLARLDPDGIFCLYNRSLDLNDTWMPMWRSKHSKCDPKGICGANSFCAYEDHTVTCTCLPGFSDSGGACREDFDPLVCRNKNKSVKYEITRMANVTWEDNYYTVDHTATEEDCGRACIDDCDCVVALFKDGQCRRQRSPLSLRYGRRSTGDSSMTLVRLTLPSPAPPPPPDDSGKATAPVGSGKNVEKILQFLLIKTSYHFSCFKVTIFLSGPGKRIPGSKKKFFDLHKFVVIIGKPIMLLHSN